MIPKGSLAPSALVFAALLCGGACSSPTATARDGGPTPGPAFDAAAQTQSGPDAASPERCHVSAEEFPSRPLTVTSSEVAVRLAGFLWQRPADAALLKRTTTLRTTKDVAALALEMQKDDRFGTGLDAFTNSWLELQDLPSVMPSEFVGFDAALAADMQESARRFVRAVFADPTGTLASLMTSPLVVFNARLAPFLGLPFDGSAGEWQQLMAPAGTRTGVATLLARLTAAPRISPRGMWIRSRILCRGLVPAPPADQPELAASGGSFRQRLEAITLDERCTGCHGLFDDLGVAFEHFDDVGQFRKDDHGFAIDVASSVTLDGQAAVGFDSSGEFMRLIGDSCEAEACFLQSWLGHALGANSAAFTDASGGFTQILGAFHAAGKRTQALPAIIAESPAFLAP